MVFNRKHLPAFLGLALLGLVIGSLAWEIFERILQAAGSSFSLTLAAPLALDLHVVVFSFRPNLGSLLGIIAGIVLFLAV